MDRNKIIKILKEDILMKGLELEDIGISIDEITDDVRIIGDEGLALDSVDALEIVAQVKKHFNIQIEDVNQEFFEKNLSNLSNLTTFVEHSIKEK